MAKKDKTKTKKKSKKGLSTADILKIIKKLKPQTQQIVKVNVGEDNKKKKKGEVQSSYNPPFVFPAQGYPAITSLGQPPFQPPLIEAPRQAASWSNQPIVEPKKLMPPPPSTPYITDIESEIEIIPREKRKTKKESATSEYKVRQPYGGRESKLKSGFSFNEPKFAQPSNLSQASAEPSRFYQPVVNDKYQEDIIQTNPAGDQIGTLSNKVPSDLWVESPEGNIVLTAEELQLASEKESEIVSPENVFLEEPTYEEEQQQQQQEEIVVPVQGVSPPQKEQKVDIGLKTISSRMIIDEINKAVKDNKFVITNIPSEYIASKGATKGQIKQQSKNNITSDMIRPIYDEMLLFTGQTPKKAPFIVKK